MSNSVEQLKAAIAKSPTSVTIEADKSVFQMYKEGIFDSTECGTSLDHAVMAVGYGTENGKEYYIVRNSWGPMWGDGEKMGTLKLLQSKGMEFVVYKWNQFFL